MADQYSKKPTVTRFNRKKTYAGRDVKRTVVSKRGRPGIAKRAERLLRPMRSK